jgi:hypothetical protein
MGRAKGHVRSRARQSWSSISVNGSKHVVVGEDVIETHILNRLAEFADNARIASKFVLRICDTDFHEP